MPLTALTNSLKNINIEQLIWDIIDNRKKDILALNTKDQLFDKGIDITGKSMFAKHPYAPSTVKRKKRKGQPTDRVTLKDTGELHSEFNLLQTQTDIEIRHFGGMRGGVDLMSKLVEKYGEVEGLTEENVNKLTWDIVYPDLMIRIDGLLRT